MNGFEKIRWFMNVQHICAKVRDIRLKGMQRALKNREFSLIANNCNGGVLLHDLALEFRSPFVDLFIRADDYVKMLQDFRSYMDADLEFFPKGEKEDPFYGKISYPVAKLRDITVYFMHYQTEEEAEQIWYRRRARIKWDNLFIMMTDQNGCSQKTLKAFDELSFQNKVVFTHTKQEQLRSAYYIKGFEKCDEVGLLLAFENERLPIRRYYEQFDFVRWFNGDGN